MKYRKISVSFEPEITGNDKGGYSVEIKDKMSFNNDMEKKYFYDFFEENDENYNRVFIDTFKKINTNKLSKIIFYPKTKKIKEIDLLVSCPHKLGLNFIISKKMFDIMMNFNLPPINKISVQINSFDTEYLLIGFPMIPQDRIDLSESLFFDTKEKAFFKFKSNNEYMKTNFSVIPKKISPNVFYDFDAISFQGKGTFFSERLINAMQGAEIIGLHISDTEMEMNPRKV
ncbi:hypothetical protein [Citrobacter farmeri]|uniref:hypothetical protein n=1 Tax=Citrobacter farmeri TaxID=67824 RepID=UPI00189EBE0C|nr:hypothetical protein [Citrobacter farmeri]EKU0082639.1 hypothetical protein [Citrobacter farmeri]MDZ7531710.1 hypothetical protein [Citrobacter farmeri]